MRDVIEKLGAQRIQHGVRALEDPELVSMLRDNGIALDVCPISNVKLRVVPSAREHPIKKLVEAGVVCTVSTDDPISFGNTIEDEYEFLARELDFNESSLAQIAQNGFRVALPGRRTEV